MSNRTRPRLTVNYTRPFVYPYQRSFMDNPERFTVVEGATKIGKTAPLIIWLLEQALKGKEGHNFWWVAPIRAQAKIAFTRMKKQVSEKKFFKVNESDLTLTLPNGAVMHFKSADNPDSLYGEDVYAAVFDEASRANQLSWFALRSTLTSTGGKCKFIANVRGRGWYYKLAQKAKNGGDPEYAYRKITCWDAVMTGPIDVAEVISNKHKIVSGEDDPADQKRRLEVYQKLLAHGYANVKYKKPGRLSLREVLQAKGDVPDFVFRELYEAEPSDDGGNPFGIKNLDACKMKGLAPGPAKSFGVDLASTIDFTVEVGLNTEKAVCLFNRYQMDWEQTTANVGKLPDVPTAIDGTGVGKPIVERLQKNRRHTLGFIFTPNSKQQLLEALATAFKMRETTFPEGGVLEDELYSFEYTHTRYGVRYSAPEGLHDDCVMAYALAYDQHRHQPPVGNTTAKRVQPKRGREY